MASYTDMHRTSKREYSLDEIARNAEAMKREAAEHRAEIEARRVSMGVRPMTAGEIRKRNMEQAASLVDVDVSVLESMDNGCNCWNCAHCLADFYDE